MSISCLSQVVLEYVGGGSDKIYVIQVQEVDTGSGPSEYRAVGYYGRRGSKLSKHEKYKGASKASAESNAARLEKEKRTGRTPYTTMAHPAGKAVIGMPSDAPVFGGASVATPGTAPTTPTIVGILPMLATAIDEATAESYVPTGKYAVQRKYDGERVVISLRRTGISATNRKGASRPISAAVEEELKRLLPRMDFNDERETEIDGELMGDVFVAYDLLTLRDNDLRDTPFFERYTALETLLEDHLGLLAPTAWTEEEIRAMWEQATAEGWEGLIFRDMDALYVSGRSAGLLKYKLWATCTCRVLATNTVRSIQLGLLDEAGNEVFCGNVTVPINQTMPEPDDLVEVRYLYAHEGGSLYQPTLLSIRTDIDNADLRSSIKAAPPEKSGLPLAA